MPNIQVLQFGSLGSFELIALLVVIIILLFGASKIPSLAKSLGRARGEFEKGKQEVEMEIKEAKMEKPETKEDEREKLEKAARALGIDVEGKSLEELREAIKKAT